MQDNTNTNERLLRLPEVIKLTGLKRSSVYLAINEKRFPTPIKISERSIGWMESEVMQWIADRVQTSRKGV